MQESKIHLIHERFNKLVKLAAQLEKTPRRFGTNEPLSSREIQVLELLAEGATNRDISRRLFITTNTTKSHVINIFNKLGVFNRTQAAVCAIKKKLIQV